MNFELNSPFVHFKVQELRQEVQDRGVPALGESRNELRATLDKKLCGIKRPIALGLQSGNGFMVDDKLLDYAVAQLEPLHDLKTIIGKYDKITKFGNEWVSNPGQFDSFVTLVYQSGHNAYLFPTCSPGVSHAPSLRLTLQNPIMV